MKSLIILFLFVSIVVSPQSETIGSDSSLTFSSDIEWFLNSDSIRIAPILVNTDKIFVAGNNGTLTCLNHDGKTIWISELERTIISKPFRDRDLVVLPTMEGDLISMNANNGEIVQTIGIGDTLTSKSLGIDLESGDGKSKGIIIATFTGDLYCYDIYTFELVWENNSKIKNINHLEVSGDNVIITTSVNIVYSINKNNGTLIWKWSPGKNISFYSDPVQGVKSLFLSGSNKTLYSIDILSGTVRWQKTNIGTAHSMSISESKKELYLRNSNELLIVDAASGKMLKKIKISYPPDIPSSLSVLSNDIFYFTSSDGILRMTAKDLIIKPIFFSEQPLIAVQLLNENEIITADIIGNVWKLKIIR